MNETIEAEVVTAQALAVREPEEKQQVSLFRTDDPSQIITNATNVASSLKAVIQKQGLISRISGKEYPRCEAWTLLGTMLGVFPILCWSRQVEGGWEARVEAKTLAGAIIGAAEAQCLKTERNWSNRDDFALRSMAQTRATAKALRMPLGFVMTLAGYQPTPAEEMVSEEIELPAPKPVVKPVPAQVIIPKATKKQLNDEQERDDLINQLNKLCPTVDLQNALCKYLEKFVDKDGVERCWLIPGEGIFGLSNEKLSLVVKGWSKLLPKIDELATTLTKPEVPAPSQPACPNCGSYSYIEMRNGAKVHRVCQDCKLQDNVSEPETTVKTAGQALANATPKDAEEWKSYPVPQWSKYFKAGKETLGDLAKGELWWFCCVWQPKVSFKGGKTYHPTPEDYELRGILDKVKAAYGFTEPKDEKR